MKKFVCMMLVVLLVCLSAAALAEAKVDQSVIDSFGDTWVGEGDGHYAAEIWYEDGAFHCRGTRHISVDEGYSFEFERCTYDAEAGALVCEGGVLRHELRGEADGKIASEDVATGFGATLTVDEKHHLHWTGSGDALPDLEYASLDEVGEESWYDTHDDGGDDDDESAANSAGDAFVGDWMCERASIYIDEDDNVYNVWARRARRPTTTTGSWFPPKWCIPTARPPSPSTATRCCGMTPRRTWPRACASSASSPRGTRSRTEQSGL